MAPTAGARSRGRPHPDLLGRGDRRLERRRPDVELAAVMVTEPKHPVHGVGAGALRRDTDREDDAAVLHRPAHGLSLELDAIGGRQFDDPVTIGVREPESIAHRDLRHDDRLLAHSGRRVLDADDEGGLRVGAHDPRHGDDGHGETRHATRHHLGSCSLDRAGRLLREQPARPVVRARRDAYFETAKTQMTPPCGTSLGQPRRSPSRPCWNAGSTPQPDTTLMYWTPSTAKDDGGAMMPEFVVNCHNTFPLPASKARKFRSFVPPAKTSPPPVVRTPPQLIESGYWWLHARFPELTSQAWISPKYFAPLSTVKPISGMSTPVHHCPATYCCTLPSMKPQWLSLAGMNNRPVLGL